MQNSRDAFERLPTEIASIIIDYLAPSDAIAAKYSCKKFLFTPRSPKDLFGELDSWEAFNTKAFCERMSAPELLCVLCLKRHARSEFPDSSRRQYGTVRSCQSRGAAIELGLSRLTMAAISQTVQGVPTQRSGNWSYPKNLYVAASEFEAEKGRDGQDNKLYLHSPFYSPFPFDDDSKKYSSEQWIHIRGGNAELLSLLQLSGINRGIFSQSDAAHRLKEHISALEVWGGLWICPHLPLDSQFFCQMVSVLVQYREPFEFACAICRTQVKLGTFRLESIDLSISISKDLGPFAELGKTQDPNNNKHIQRYLSTRFLGF